jgi:hypothetical protein
MGNEWMAGVPPVTRRVRAFFAPVDRVSGQATMWDPSGIQAFTSDSPPAPWIDLGWCHGFERHSATKIGALLSGAPGLVSGQVRQEIEATVSLRFGSWGKLQMALTSGVQQMNVLLTQSGTAANGSGGSALASVALLGDSTSTALDVGAASTGFHVGDLVAVDVDYTGQTGFIGSGISGGYVKLASRIASDPHYVRRITLNVSRVVAISGGILGLGGPLPAGSPVAGMKVSRVAGFCDREGGSFFQEWSALFVIDGEQGDRIVFHYPRLQAMAGAAETSDTLGHGVVKQDADGLKQMQLQGSFRALPVRDRNDGELIVCFRSYLPGAMRAV